MIVYIGIFCIFIVINHHRIFEDYDEFNHWALIIKNMYLYNQYGTVRESIITFNEYPPFTACFQYILLNIKGVYAEDAIIISQNLLYLSMIIPVCAKVEFKKKFRNLLLIIPSILILPLLLYEDFFTNILVDGFLGILFAMGLFTIYKRDKNQLYKNLTLTLLITALALTKTTGIPLAVLLLIFALVKTKKHRLKTVFIIATLPIILVSTWYIKVKIANVSNEWDFNKVVQTTNKEKTALIIKHFISNMFESNKIVGKRLCMTYKILLMGAFSIYVYKKVASREKKKAYVHILIETIISFILFSIGMVWMYATIFTDEEALNLTCYDRYMHTILLSWLTLNTAIILNENKKINLSTIYVFIVISLSILPNDVIYEKYINSNQYIKVLQIKRNYYYNGFKKYEKMFEQNDKIYFISNINTNNPRILKLHKYQMMTNNIANKEPNKYGTQFEFTNTLLNEGYNYVYIYRVEDEFKKEFKELFEDKEVEQETLYRVEKKSAGILELRKVEGMK